MSRGDLLGAIGEGGGGQWCRALHLHTGPSVPWRVSVWGGRGGGRGRGGGAFTYTQQSMTDCAAAATGLKGL